MPIGVLSFHPSVEKIYSGLPKTVAIQNSSPTSLTYYTTDGTIPNLLSHVYIEPVASVGDAPLVLTAISYDFDGASFLPGVTLSFTWTQTSAAWTENGKFGRGEQSTWLGGASHPYLYGYDGQVVATISIPATELKILHSTRDAQGRAQPSDFHQNIATGEGTPQTIDDPFGPFYTMVGASNFRPEASLFVVDTRTGSATLPHTPMANGPHMKLRNSEKYRNGVDFRSVESDVFVSSSHIRSFHSEKTNTMAAYYFDSVDNKWVKSVSTVRLQPQQTAPLTYRHPFVYQWSRWGSHYSY